MNEITLHKTNRLGFSLIELLICIAIIAILSAVVYPNFNSYVLKAKRIEAQTILMTLATAQEKHFQQTMQYSSELNVLVNKSNVEISNQSNYQYQITTTSFANDGINSFTINAVAINSQSKDTGCLRLTVTHLNQRLAYGANNSLSANCW